LNAPTHETDLAPNVALQDPNFCNQCKPWKLIALKVLLKTFTQCMRKMPEKDVLPQTRLIRYRAKGTRQLIRFARSSSIQRFPHPWQRLSLKFGIFICDRNSNTWPSTGPHAAFDWASLNRANCWNFQIDKRNLGISVRRTL